MNKKDKSLAHLLAIAAMACALALICHIARSCNTPCPQSMRHDVSWKAYCASTGHAVNDTTGNSLDDFLDGWVGSTEEEEALLAHGIEP